MVVMPNFTDKPKKLPTGCANCGGMTPPDPLLRHAHASVLRYNNESTLYYLEVFTASLPLLFSQPIQIVLKITEF